MGKHHKKCQVGVYELLNDFYKNLFPPQRCVDKFFVWVWPDGTQKTGSTARKIEVDKKKISAIVDVEPCIGYR